MTNLIRLAVAPAALIALAIGPPAHAADRHRLAFGRRLRPRHRPVGRLGRGRPPDRAPPWASMPAGTAGLNVGAGPQGAAARREPGVGHPPGHRQPVPGSGFGTGRRRRRRQRPARSPRRRARARLRDGPRDRTVETGTGAGGAASAEPARARHPRRGSRPARAATPPVPPTGAPTRSPPPSAATRGVAPVLDLIEKIPPALWAALAALGADRPGAVADVGARPPPARAQRLGRRGQR